MRFFQARRVLAGMAIVLIGTTTFVLMYRLRGPDPVSRASTGQTPSDQAVTPAPGATPDVSQPFWYVPYQNQEKAKPKFEGELGGAQILSNPPEFDAATLCPSGLRQAPGEALQRASEGETAIKLPNLPLGVVPLGEPEVWVCGSDTVQVSWSLEVRAGTSGVETNGSGLSITRTKGERLVFAPASAERWKEIELPTGDAAILLPVIAIEGRYIGGCAFIHRNAATNVLTVLRASAASPQFCESVGSEVAR